MELFLDNIGIIKNSTVKVDGLTVITGKNNSGKTTVGKVLYSLIRANSNKEDAFAKARNAYINSKLYEISNVLSARRFYLDRVRRFEEATIDEPLTEFGRFIYILGSRDYRKFSSEKLISFLYDLNEGLQELTIEEQWEFSERDFNIVLHDKEYLAKFREQFEEKKQVAIKICYVTINTVEDNQAFDKFAVERVKAFLNLAFNNQIKPVRNVNGAGKIKLTDSERTLMDIQINGKIDFDFKAPLPVVLAYNQSIFIDDPFVLDRIETGVRDNFYYNENDNAIYSVDVTSYREYLIQLLSTRAADNFFENLELQKRYNKLLEKINLIVPGEFQETKEGVFYVNEDVKLSVPNLATGSKLFFIIKLLLMNGNLNDETVLVLDEPESHLHPEWINKFSEILVLLIKELKVRVLLTTHSSNLLLALEWFSKYWGITESTHFYLAHAEKEGSWASVLDCIDQNINKGYAHLSLPLIEMTIMQKAMEERSADEHRNAKDI